MEEIIDNIPDCKYVVVFVNKNYYICLKYDVVYYSVVICFRCSFLRNKTVHRPTSYYFV